MIVPVGIPSNNQIRVLKIYSFRIERTVRKNVYCYSNMKIWTYNKRDFRTDRHKIILDSLICRKNQSIICILRNSDICGVFNKFPDFFVLAFKIVVDSWKFSMLLLYILWDDRPIFMISCSNEQLQQQLEYTLLKPDCHNWWISQRQSGLEDTLEERYAIKFCFKLGKNAKETTYGMLQTAFRPSCMNWASIFEWHKRFKEGRESVRDDERCGRSKEVNTPELIGQRVRVRVTLLRF